MLNSISIHIDNFLEDHTLVAEILLLAHDARGFILFVTSDCQLWHYP